MMIGFTAAFLYLYLKLLGFAFYVNRKYHNVQITAGL